MDKTVNKKTGRKTISFDWRRVKEFMGKRSVIMAAMLALLAVTGALSLKYAGVDLTLPKSAKNIADEAPVSEVAMNEENVETTATFFSDYRSERNSVRSQEINYLNSIIENSATDVSLINEAQSRKLEITDTMEKEVTLEGLLRAKGFSEVIVTLGEETVNVVVGEEAISSAEAAQILDAVMTETGESADAVRIIPAG